jgi:Ner family transcriptional regulator
LFVAEICDTFPLVFQITHPRKRLAGLFLGFRRGAGVTGTPTQHWDRHSILAEIKRRFGSLNALAARAGIAPGHLSVALGEAYPKGERIISRALGIKPQLLWPDRYDAKGHRLRSRPTAAKASQESARGAA